MSANETSPLFKGPTFPMNVFDERAGIVRPFGIETVLHNGNFVISMDSLARQILAARGIPEIVDESYIDGSGMTQVRQKVIKKRTAREEYDPEIEIHLPCKLSIVPKELIVAVNEDVIPMPLQEMRMLHYLATEPTVVRSRVDIATYAWGHGDKGVRNVDVHANRLRMRLDSHTGSSKKCDQPGPNAPLILTARKLGYVLGQRALEGPLARPRYLDTVQRS